MESLSQSVARLALLSSQEECLRMTYTLLSRKYRGYRIKTYLRFWELGVTDTEQLWARSGFLHCTHMNRLLRVLLVDSGHFTDEEIITRWTLVWGLSPHQYSVISMQSGDKVFVDIWGKAYGVPFGNYAHGFNSTVTCGFFEIE